MAKKLGNPAYRDDESRTYTHDELLDVIDLVLSTQPTKEQASVSDLTRIGVLAVKHCPTDHQDFSELKELIEKLFGESDE